jgi:hypothetical protein
MAIPQSTHPSASPQLAKAAARFWAKVDTSGECWLWTGPRNKWGYGYFWLDGRNHKATRVAYELLHGPIPDGLHVLHDCPGGDNPSCVRHLYPGTHLDNMRDKVGKGRSSRPTGEQNPSAKLTDADVRNIRQLHAETQANYKTLALRFNVDRRTVACLVERRTWRHID